MLIARWIIGLLLLGALLCFAIYIGTGLPHWRRLGMVIVKWTVIAGLVFFGVQILERLALIG